MNTEQSRPTVETIDAAALRISSVVEATPLQYCARLSQIHNLEVYLKREDLQHVRSYKIRGAYNLMSQLDGDQRAAGVVTASAGNHAQGVAFACKSLEVPGRIYVPANTPMQKRDRIKVHGGSWVELIVIGDTYDDAQTEAIADVQRTGAVYVPPFNHPETIAGQGTIAREILNQLPRVPDSIVIPVGGGGLLAGATICADASEENIHIVGAEPAGAPSMKRSVEAGKPVTLTECDTFVDGAAVKAVGELTFQIAADFSGRLDLVEVDEGAICTAMLGLYQNEGIITEPAGALAVAALDYADFEPSSVVVCVVSGGNNDVSRYSEIIERSLVHSGLKHYFLVDFPQKPGQLRLFLDDILGPTDDITLFEYVKRNNRETGAALVGVQLHEKQDLQPLLSRMHSSPLHCEQLQPGTPAYEYLT